MCVCTCTCAQLSPSTSRYSLQLALYARSQRSLPCVQNIGAQLFGQPPACRRGASRTPRDGHERHTPFRDEALRLATARCHCRARGPLVPHRRWAPSACAWSTGADSPCTRCGESILVSPLSPPQRASATQRPARGRRTRQSGRDTGAGARERRTRQSGRDTGAGA